MGKSQRVALCSRPLREDAITNQRTDGEREGGGRRKCLQNREKKRVSMQPAHEVLEGEGKGNKHGTFLSIPFFTHSQVGNLRWQLPNKS